MSQKEVVRSDEKEIKAFEVVIDEEYRRFEKATKDKDNELARELLQSHEEKRKALDQMRALAQKHVNGKELNKMTRKDDYLDKKGLFTGLKND